MTGNENNEYLDEYEQAFNEIKEIDNFNEAVKALIDHAEKIDNFDILLSVLTEQRRNIVSGYMEVSNIDAVVLHDCEEHRSPAVRYLCGVPQDCIYVLSKDGKQIVCPWDVNLAKSSLVDAPSTNEKPKIVPYTNYNCDPVTATKDLLKKLKIKENSRVEIENSISYPDFLNYVDEMPEYDIVCKKDRVISFVNEQRIIKDPYEIYIAKEASKITNEIIDLVEEKVRSKELKTEIEVAQFIEARARSNGAERTSFETLAAGPKRSWAIHAFPTYTDSEFATNGLSILDFGIYYKGFSTDVTMTFAVGKLTEKQEKMLALVQEAADECLKYYKPDMPIRQAAIKADKIFSREKLKMPHGLGHGIGLEIHEAPRVKSKLSLEEVFLPGMIVTLEPGLYDQNEGGVRLENDVLITEEGNEVLTKSRIVRIS